MEKIGSLELFGPEFQIKVISLLLSDPSFLQQIFDIIDPTSFESNSRKWIVDLILEYYDKYQCAPTALVFKEELGKVPSDVLKVSIRNELKKVSLHLLDKDAEYIKDKFLQFCKNQTLKNAILKSVDFLEQENYDGIKKEIDTAMHAGLERNYGHDWKKDIEKRLFETPRNTIATPWDCINNVMDGGLAAGELGLIAAPGGAGKSWILAAIGAAAVRNGKKVLHFTLELNDGYTGLRYDTLFTGIEPAEVKNHYDELKEIIAKVPGEIIIKYFPSKTINSHSLLAHIKQVENIGFVPDILIVDYADLLRSHDKTEARYLELGAIYEELRSLAGELYLPCWTASQTQRSSIQDEVIQADKIAESYNKIMTADFVMSLSRTMNDKQTNTARAHIIKNRFGPDAITYPATINVIKGIVDVFDENSPQGIQARRSMGNADNIVKKMLHQKLNDTKVADTAVLG